MRRAFVLAALLGLVAILVAGVVNTAWALILAGPDGQLDDLGFLVVAGLIAPVIEEYAKVAPLVAIRGGARRLVDVRQWVLLGAALGGAFGLAEGLAYAFLPVALSGDGVAWALVYGVAQRIPFHALTAALSAYGYASGLVSGRARPLVLALALAVAIHAGSNVLGILAGEGS